MKSARGARAALCLDTDMEMTWTGKRSDMAQMIEIGGEAKVVISISIKLAFKMNEVTCMVMCFKHIEIVDYCLHQMDEEELMHYALVAQVRQHGKKSKK